MGITRFEDIEGWQVARELTGRIYHITNETDFRSDYGLKDQIRRASGSIMHNIAEGFEAGSNAEFVRFLRYAHRSCAEVQSQLYIALDQQYIQSDQFNELYALASSAQSKIGGFISYLRRFDRK